MTKNSFKVLAGAMAIMLIGAQTATAAGLLSMSNTLSREQISTIANHSICFQTPTGVTAGQTLTYTFPALFTMGTFAIGNFDFKTGASCAAAASETIAASASGATWGVAQAGQVVTVTSGTDTIAANQFVVLNINGQITNPNAEGSYVIDIGGTFADSGSLAVPIEGDDTVTITATVDPYINFDIDDTAVGFGDMVAGTASYANAAATGSASEVTAHILTADTNGTGGYVITVTAPATLTNAAGDTITAIGAAPTAHNASVEQFGARVAAPTGGSIGTVTISSPFNGAAGSFGGLFNNTVETVATQTSPTALNTYNVSYLANTLATTESGDYSANLTYIATATF